MSDADAAAEHGKVERADIERPLSRTDDDGDDDDDDDVDDDDLMPPHLPTTGMPPMPGPDSHSGDEADGSSRTTASRMVWASFSPRSVEIRGERTVEPSLSLVPIDESASGSGAQSKARARRRSRNLPRLEEYLYLCYVRKVRGGDADAGAAVAEAEQLTMPAMAPISCEPASSTVPPHMLRMLGRHLQHILSASATTDDNLGSVAASHQDKAESGSTSAGGIVAWGALAVSLLALGAVVVHSVRMSGQLSRLESLVAQMAVSARR
jgi:hypothetical protein